MFRSSVTISISTSCRLGGSRTILVRSAISGRVDIDGLLERRRPDAVVDGVADLLDWL